MVTITVLLIVVAVVVVVVRRRAQRDTPAVPGGVLSGLVDQGRDLIAPLFPSQPLSRRALPRRLLRAAEQTITVGVSGMVLVPTRIRIAVNPADIEPFTDAMEWLQRDLAEALRQKATENGWVVPDGPHVEVVPDEDRPLRLPRAVGRIDAFRPDDVRTRRWLPSPGERPPGSAAGPQATAAARPEPGAGPEPAPEQTPRTSMVVASEAAEQDTIGSAAGLDQPTVRVVASVHVRLVDLAPAADTGESDVNALLVGGAEPLVLGRSREADLQVRDRQASARHCSLALDPEGRTVTVRDLRSTNGTYVDDRRVDQAPLTTGSTLHVGGTTWRVELDQVTS